jgi:flagellar assembly protein FliH
MAKIQRFEFDLSFDREAEPVAPEVAPAEPEPPPPSFSEEELDAARKAAWAEGFREGEARAKALDERRIADAAEQVAVEMARFASAEQAVIERTEQHAAAVVLAAIRKLFPALAARDNLAEIEAMLAQIFTASIEPSRIVVHCSPVVADAVKGLLDAAVSRSGFAGRVTIVADPALAPEDCRISWGEGGIERLPRQILAKIEQTILSSLGCSELVTDLEDDSDEQKTGNDAWHGQEIRDAEEISQTDESAPLEDVA